MTPKRTRPPSPRPGTPRISAGATTSADPAQPTSVRVRAPLDRATAPGIARPRPDGRHSWSDSCWHGCEVGSQRGYGTMRLDVFKGDDLVAAFEYGKHRSYYGAPGRQVKALIERPHCARNLWTGETMRRPATDRPDWWAANILSASLA